jgi:glyoxylase-like metal-dependent hydrolase (beta-lactamase superfamily II)
MNPMLIPIKQDKPGFEKFIGSWVFPGNPRVVVDIGPSRSVSLLIQSLSRLGIERVDFVLLTHIHIDHAGGLAEFLRVFPMARVICHSKAISHLLDPTKLWKGSRTALGEMVSTYGPISPVKKEWLIPHEEAKLPGLKVIQTPGHAAHHLSYIYEGNLFAGEAGGVYLRLGTSDYLRPATPPPFFLKEFVESIDRLIAEGDLPICYGHFGRAEKSRPMLKRAGKQLLLWESIIREKAASQCDETTAVYMEILLREDPELTAYQDMPPADQERERFFMANSIKGYVDYVQKFRDGP